MKLLLLTGQSSVLPTISDIFLKLNSTKGNFHHHLIFLKLVTKIPEDIKVFLSFFT